MPVVSLNNGQQLGRVKRLLIDQQKMLIAGFTIDRKGLFKEQPVVPYKHVKSVGNHAVTVDQDNAVAKLSSLPELEILAKQSLPLLGGKVITEDGTILGTVQDFRFDPRDGKIYALELSKGLLHSSRLLDINYIITCGRDAIIAKTNAEENLQKTGNLFGCTWQEEAGSITRKISGTFNRCRENLPFLSKKNNKDNNITPPGE